MLFRMLSFGVFYIVMSSYSAQSAFSQVSSDQEACAKAMSGWSAQEKADLCKIGGTLDTAKCAKAMTGWSEKEKADLCKNGGTFDTAKCAKAMGGRSKQERIDLCSKSQK
jgi:hypothetical protein